MTLTIRRYRRKANNFYQPDYTQYDEKKIVGDSAAECMRSVESYKMENNVSVYTPYEITKVED